MPSTTLLQNLSYILVCFTFGGIYALAILLSARFCAKQLQRWATVLKAGERPRVIEVLVETSVRRVSEDPQFLRDFLDRYLGDASAVKRQTWEQAVEDPNSIRDMIVDSHDQMNDEQLVSALKENSNYMSEHDIVGFDPRTRLVQLREARKLFSSRQWPIVLGGFVVFLLMVLFPPWLRQKDDVTWMLFSQRSRKVLQDNFIGYRCILLERKPADKIERLHTGDLGKSRQIRTRTVVALRFLIPQFLFVTAAVAITIHFLRIPNNLRNPNNKLLPPSDDRCPEQNRDPNVQVDTDPAVEVDTDPE